MGSSRMNVRDFSEWDESDVRVRPNKKGSRPRTKDRPTFKEAIRGRVITVDRGRWSVVVDEGTEKERTLIAARAKELRRTAIVTGDFVDLVGDTSGAKDTLARIVRRHRPVGARGRGECSAAGDCGCCGEPGAAHRLH